MTREEACYYKILLSNGITDGYSQWLNEHLESEDPLSDIVLNLSFCESNTDETIRYLHNYCAEEKFDEKAVCTMLREFLKKTYYEKRFSMEEVCSLMYGFSQTVDDPGGFDNIWLDMFSMKAIYEESADGYLSMNDFVKAFHSYLDNGESIFPIVKKVESQYAPIKNTSPTVKNTVAIISVICSFILIVFGILLVIDEAIDDVHFFDGFGFTIALVFAAIPSLVTSIASYRLTHKIAVRIISIIGIAIATCLALLSIALR